MAIFKSVFESQTDEFDVELEAKEADYTFDESDTFDDTLTEYCKEMYALDAVMYISDIQLETAVFEGSIESVETLAEKTLGDFFESIKKKITEIWYKIKDWIREKIMNIRAGFAAASSFMKKHGDSIPAMLDKGAKEYKFTGYAYNAIDILSQTFDKVGSKIEGDMTSAMSATTAPDTSSSELIGEIGKMFKGDAQIHTIAELGTVILEYARGTHRVDHHPEPAEATPWVKTCKAAADILKNIDGAGQKVEKNVKKSISELKKLESQAKKNDRDNDAAVYHAKARYLAQLIAIQSKCTTYTINATIEGIKAMSSRCKAIYKKGKGTKADENVSASYIPNLFENAFNYL